MEKLSLSKKEISRILEAIPDIFYRTDNKGIIQFVSSSAENIFGYKPHEVIGTSLADLYLEPEDRNSFLKTMQSRGGRVSGYEARMIHKISGDRLYTGLLPRNPCHSGR